MNSSEILPDMVQEISVSDQCLKPVPYCEHTTKIVLKDGREWTGPLSCISLTTFHENDLIKDCFSQSAADKHWTNICDLEGNFVDSHEILTRLFKEVKEVQTEKKVPERARAFKARANQLTAVLDWYYGDSDSDEEQDFLSSVVNIKCIQKSLIHEQGSTANGCHLKYKILLSTGEEQRSKLYSAEAWAIVENVSKNAMTEETYNIAKTHYSCALYSDFSNSGRERANILLAKIFGRTIVDNLQS